MRYVGGYQVNWWTTKPIIDEPWGLHLLDDIGMKMTSSDEPSDYHIGIRVSSWESWLRHI